MQATRYFSQHTQATTLAYFRIAFGLLMLISLIRFMAFGWVDKFYVQPDFHFKYFGFSWVSTWGEYTYLLFAISMLACVGIILGYKYRWSMLVFFLSFTYIELIDKTTYLNHYYFISLLSFVLIWLPMNACFSIDARLRGKTYKTVPRWTVGVIQLSLAIVYFYAGLAKLNSDWLLRAQPLKIWLSSQSDIPLIGDWFRATWFHLAMSWSGAIYDLLIPFALVFRKTRPYAFAAVVFFHLFTRYLFPIGMFPYIMIVSTTIFFSPDYHARVIAWLRAKLRLTPPTQLIQTYRPAKAGLMVKAFAVFFAIQLLFPFRHLAYPSELFWSEEGFRFSWRVMLIEKGADTQFTVVDKETGKTVFVHLPDYLTPFQQKQMSFQADFILEFAHHLGNTFSKHMAQPQVFVESMVSLNGRNAQQFIDPTADLMLYQEGWQPKTWIIPFEDEISGI